MQQLESRPLLVGCSQAIEGLRLRLSKIACSPAPVLIEGETGTGKEVCSRLLHHQSGRRGLFVAVNLGALQPTLIESELFGHERGAFTNATTSKKGRFEMADGGTILLDEVGEMPLDLQVKLLRVIQESEVERVGGGLPIKVDVRVIAATNRDLKREVERRTFRDDLYYRLAVVKVRIPPLRERENDVVILAEHFARIEKGEGNFSFREPDFELMRSFYWSGNVRQLQSVVRRACVMSPGRELDIAQALAEEWPDEPGTAGSGGQRVRINREELVRHCHETDGNIAEIARRLMLDRDRVKRALRMYRIDINQFRPRRVATAYSELEPTAGEPLLSFNRPLAETIGGPRRPLRPPGGPYDKDWYVSRPEEERAALSYLASAGTPAVLWGPRRFGKSTLGQHLLDSLAMQQPAHRVVKLDLREFSDDTRSSLDSLLRAWSVRILQDLRLPIDWVEAAWARPNDCKGQLSWLLEHHVIPADDTVLILSIDHIDSLLGQRYVSDFFGLLRAWAERGGGPAWSQLRMLLMVSTMPSTLTLDLHQSPFNLTAPIYLDELSTQQIGSVGRLYGLALEPGEIDLITSWVGGHPFLVRLAMYEAARCDIPISLILDPSSAHHRIFDDYLQYYRGLLERKPALLAALSKLIEDKKPIDRSQYHALHRAGLVMQRGPAEYALRCRLYENVL